MQIWQLFVLYYLANARYIRPLADCTSLMSASTIRVQLHAQMIRKSSAGFAFSRDVAVKHRVDTPSSPIESPERRFR